MSMQQQALASLASHPSFVPLHTCPQVPAELQPLVGCTRPPAADDVPLVGRLCTGEGEGRGRSRGGVRQDTAAAGQKGISPACCHKVEGPGNHPVE
jgi:hypothetical protein